MIGRALRAQASAIAWIIVFATVSTVVGIYILSHQRLHLPGQNRYSVKVDFSRSTSLSPGFGQPVTVAGVKVGAVNAVALDDASTVVTVQIDPSKLPHVYSNARAALIPATPSKDMQVDLDPGTPAAGTIGKGAIPVGRTDIPIDSDELTAALDADTRDYLTTLISSAGIGLKDRGPDLKSLIRTLRPTFRQVREINTEMAARQSDLAHLVHNFEELSGALADEAPQLGGLVRDSSRSLHASAVNDRALGTGLSLLPPTLRASRTTLDSGRALVNELRPTLLALTPGTRKTPLALDKAQPVLDKSIPLIRDQVRPLVAHLQPLARQLRPSIRRLTSLTPALTRGFAALRYFTNELSYDAGSQRGYLFWMAWLAHNTASILSTHDSVGPQDRGFTVVSCDTASPASATGDVVALITALAQTACPKGG